jgi:iron(III) transport system ATP-binding protein/putative spermidine/putrescine transport system ATP-binding protein
VRLGPPEGAAQHEAAQHEAAQHEAAQHEAARKTAKVTGRVYLGDSVRYHVELEPSGVTVVAEQPRSAGTSWQPGAAVTASFAAADLLPLHATPGS